MVVELDSASNLTAHSATLEQLMVRLGGLEQLQLLQLKLEGFKHIQLRNQVGAR